jgi:hypothetical protein
MTSAAAPVDGGAVRLDKGDFVSVEAQARAGGRHGLVPRLARARAQAPPRRPEWYMTPPMEDRRGRRGWRPRSRGPCTSSSSTIRPPRRLEALARPGSRQQARGAYVSEPQPRHDAFQLGWAAATPASGTDCTMKIALVPADAGLRRRSRPRRRPDRQGVAARRVSVGRRG